MNVSSGNNNWILLFDVNTKDVQLRVIDNYLIINPYLNYDSFNVGDEERYFRTWECDALFEITISGEEATELKEIVDLDKNTYEKILDILIREEIDHMPENSCL